MWPFFFFYKVSLVNYYCMYRYVGATVCACGRQRTVLWSWFSPSAMAWGIRTQMAGLNTKYLSPVSHHAQPLNFIFLFMCMCDMDVCVCSHVRSTCVCRCVCVITETLSWSSSVILPLRSLWQDLSVKPRALRYA